MIGRNKVKCATYKSAGTRLKNKVRKLETIIRHNPNELTAIKRLEELRK